MFSHSNHGYFFVSAASRLLRPLKRVMTIDDNPECPKQMIDRDLEFRSAEKKNKTGNQATQEA